jgi:hypothetical protein
MGKMIGSLISEPEIGQTGFSQSIRAKIKLEV